MKVGGEYVFIVDEDCVGERIRPTQDTLSICLHHVLPVSSNWKSALDADELVRRFGSPSSTGESTAVAQYHDSVFDPGEGTISRGNTTVGNSHSAEKRVSRRAIFRNRKRKDACLSYSVFARL